MNDVCVVVGGRAGARSRGRTRMGWHATGRKRPGSKRQRLLIKILSKSIDFERRAGSGAAGDRKVNGFELKTFRKALILSAGPGRERPGIGKPSIFH